MPPEKKREVMCMEQIGNLIVQYADGIVIVAGVFACILLAVTSHRIKRVEKLMHQILDRLPSQEKTVVSAEPVRQEAVPQPAESRDSVSGGELPDGAAELLDAVLDEVFP